MKRSIIFVVNTDEFFLSHRLPIAIAAKKKYNVYVATKSTGYHNIIKSHGFEHFQIDIDRSSLNLINDIKFFIQIFKLFKKLKPDIVHLVTIKPILIGGIAAKLAKIKAIVFAVSGLGFVFTSNRVIAKIIRLVVKLFYKISTNHKNFKIIIQNKDDKIILMKFLKLSSN